MATWIISILTSSLTITLGVIWYFVRQMIDENKRAHEDFVQLHNDGAESLHMLSKELAVNSNDLKQLAEKLNMQSEEMLFSLDSRFEVYQLKLQTLLDKQDEIEVLIRDFKNDVKMVQKEVIELEKKFGKVIIK